VSGSDSNYIFPFEIETVWKLTFSCWFPDYVIFASFVQTTVTLNTPTSRKPKDVNDQRWTSVDPQTRFLKCDHINKADSACQAYPVVLSGIYPNSWSNSIIYAYSIPPYDRSPCKGKILPSDLLGRRWPVGFVRESYPIGGGTL
jgi:hypothetical protein